MSAFVHRRCNRADFLVVVDPQPEGPILGMFGEHKIASTVVDRFGRRYDYVGIATRLWMGRCDADAIKYGEWLVEPGLVYRLQATKRPRFPRRWALKDREFSNAWRSLSSRLLQLCRAVMPERTGPHSGRLLHRTHTKASHEEETLGLREGRTVRGRQKLSDE
jgi:hypothetical protein